LFLEFEDRLTVFDAMIFCRFFRDLYLWEELGETVHAVTGLSGDKENLHTIARSISDIVRKFNLREGVTADDDWLPPKMFTKLEDTGLELKAEELEYMRKEYYRLSEWDEQGVPK
ncbi:MAG: aldehyde:ferredoxin oxidoreductase, partial [Deltaproteobacteria bacterium]|nr:aldehyde:ferredoxin oxidoreductase [Deltaproteobacteria bacterium]